MRGMRNMRFYNACVHDIVLSQIRQDTAAKMPHRAAKKRLPNAVLCNRQQTAFYLFITSGDKPFHAKDFSAALGVSRVSFAPAARMEQMLGTKIGAATARPQGT